MTCDVSVYCPKCSIQFDYECEWGDAGEGSDHEIVCPGCDIKILFQIEYSPYATVEQEIDDE